MVMTEEDKKELGAIVDESIGKVALIGSALDGAAYGHQTDSLDSEGFGMDEVVAAALDELAELSRLLRRADELL